LEELIAALNYMENQRKLVSLGINTYLHTEVLLDKLHKGCVVAIGAVRGSKQSTEKEFWRFAESLDDDGWILFLK
jgi:hypothetical protein